MEQLIRHETIIDREDVKKLWSIYGDKRSYEDLQEHEISEFLDKIIDESIQARI